MMGLSLQFQKASNLLKLTESIPLIELLYRTVRYRSDDFSSELSVVRQIPKDRFAKTLSTSQLAGIQQAGYAWQKPSRTTPGSEGFIAWGALSTIVLELHRDLLPPQRDRNLLWEFYRRSENIVAPLTRQDLPADLRYLYPYVDHNRRRFDQELFLKQCTDWQIENAIGKLIRRCSGEVDCRLDLPLTEQVTK